MTAPQPMTPDQAGRIAAAMVADRRRWLLTIIERVRPGAAAGNPCAQAVLADAMSKAGPYLPPEIQQRLRHRPAGGLS